MSPTHALLWEIWQRHRAKIGAIVALTVTAWMLAIFRYSSTESRPLIDVLAIVSFVLLLGTFNYTESDSSRLGAFPERLFVLPVSSVRLVAVPAIAGIAAIELLYLLWLVPLSRGGSVNTVFVAVLLAALMVFYQSTLWTLERLGAMRLVAIGVMAAMLFAIAIAPTLPPVPPPFWRSETGLTLIVAALTAIGFLINWRHVARQRSGQRRRALHLGTLIATAAEALPGTQKPFASAAAAQFWFEWRTAGVVLPLIVGGQLLVLMGPLSWLARDNAWDSFRLLLVTLATPIGLAVPIGMAFGKPTFWTEELSLSPFVAVRPLSNEDLVAIKVKVAAASAAITWVLVLAFLAVWMALWGNLDDISQFALQLWAFHERSVAAVYGIAILIVVVGMILTWRFMVIRLWTGLSGKQLLFIASVLFPGTPIVLAIGLDADRWPAWLFDDPARLMPVTWILSLAVILKYWMAAHSWRRVSAHYVRQYLLLWLCGTIAVLALAMVVWNVARIYAAMDIYQVQGVLILLALLAMPLARLGLAPSTLALNRHR